MMADQFDSKQDLIDYVEGTLFDATTQAFDKHEKIDTFGVVFETVDVRSGKRHDPSPHVIGACRDHGVTLDALRNAAMNGGAVGAIVISQEGRQVTLVLEHKEHGLVAWKAQATRGRLGEFSSLTDPAAPRILAHTHLN